MPVQEVAYVLVADGTADPADSGGQGGSEPSLPLPQGAGVARYTRSLLRQTLQLMGVKPRPSDKAAHKVFLILQQRAALPPSEPLSLAGHLRDAPGGQRCVTLPRPDFEALLLSCLAAYDQRKEQQQPAATTGLAEPQVSGDSTQWWQLSGELQAGRDAAGVGPDPAVGDLRIACALREQRASVAVLLCGTSGTGKSTLAALLAARLGISTVVSTDSIRHMLRRQGTAGFSSEQDDPLLWASTYEAGAHLPAAGAATLEARHRQQHDSATSAPFQAAQQQVAAASAAGDPRKAAIRGYKAQSARVLEHVDRLLAGCEARRQSVVVEGVHLSLSMVVRMMQRHPSVLPFLVHISNDAKHMERFAVRSKVMTLRPDGNRYVKNFRNIRAIQDYLVNSADKHAIPKVDNTNVDRSVATIHATMLGCLRRTAQGERVLSGPSLSCKLLLEEYLRCQSATWSSSDMLDLIRRKSAAGQAPSPSEDASTATREGPTPRGPLSDVAADDQLRSASGHLSSSAVLAGSDRTAGNAGVAAGGEEGDNRSFYGSDSQSSTEVGAGSTSCTCSSSGSEDEACQGRGSSHAHDHATLIGGSAGGHLVEGDERSGSSLGMLGMPRRRRHRDRRLWHLHGRHASGGSSATGEIAAGPVPEIMRRRSEVGSVLESEQQSDTEDTELSPGVLTARA